MEALIKICGALLAASCAALLVRKSNPELTIPLSLGAICAVFALALTLTRPLIELWDRVRELYGVGDVYLLPILKCVAAAMIAKLTADLCREASQNAAASAVEFLGVLCALGAALPLIGNMLGVIGELL